MKGGGIKGIAYVGALEVLDSHYEFNWYAGTSAGAITATLLAAGYSTEELKKILEEKDFNDFKDAGFFKKLWNLRFKGGLYEAFTFKTWLNGLLGTKLKKNTQILFGNLEGFRLTIYASKRESEAIVFDSIETKEIPVSHAARSSMSIPFVFTPEKQFGFNVYDGGLQNNYPVEQILRIAPKNTTFLGLYLGPEIYEEKKASSNIFGIFKELIAIGTEGTDFAALKKYEDETVVIDPRPVSTLQFKLSEKEKDFLLEAGRLGALKYLIKHGKVNKHEFPDLEKRQRRFEAIRSDLTVIANRRRTKKRMIWLTILLLTFSTLITSFSFFFSDKDEGKKGIFIDGAGNPVQNEVLDIEVFVGPKQPPIQATVVTDEKGNFEIPISEENNIDSIQVVSKQGSLEESLFTITSENIPSVGLVKVFKHKGSNPLNIKYLTLSSHAIDYFMENQFVGDLNYPLKNSKIIKNEVYSLVETLRNDFYYYPLAGDNYLNGGYVGDNDDRIGVVNSKEVRNSKALKFKSSQVEDRRSEFGTDNINFVRELLSFPGWNADNNSNSSQGYFGKNGEAFRFVDKKFVDFFLALFKDELILKNLANEDDEDYYGYLANNEIFEMRATQTHSIPNHLIDEEFKQYNKKLIENNLATLYGRNTYAIETYIDLKDFFRFNEVLGGQKGNKLLELKIIDNTILNDKYCTNGTYTIKLSTPGLSLKLLYLSNPGKTNLTIKKIYSQKAVNKELLNVDDFLNSSNLIENNLLNDFIIEPNEKVIIPLYLSVNKRFEDSNYEFASRYVNKVDSVNVNNINYPIRKENDISISFYDFIDEGSCPYVYTKNKNDEWMVENHIIYGFNSKSKESVDELLLNRFDGKILIKENDPETSYLDYVAIKYVSPTNKEIIYLSDKKELGLKDEKYFKMDQGDSIILDFKFDKGIKQNGKYYLISKGYYLTYSFYKVPI